MKRPPESFEQELGHMEAVGRLRAAVIGAGYWGPNLARNFKTSPDWTLAAIVDTDHARASRLAAAHGDVAVYGSVQELLDTADVDAVAVATPARTHHGIALAALRAGKHVLVEKPLADHTYCYTPAVLKIRELIADGLLGDILFIESVRINLELIQPDVDVFWDLAPHDLSILDFILPGGLRPTEVSAQGADPLGTGRACVGHLTFELPGDAMAHVHVNWLSPTKIRQLVVGGSERTLVWDDLNPQQRLSIYDRGVSLDKQSTADKQASAISYRLGDTWAPALPEHEALGAMVAEFASSIWQQRAARTSGASGLRVLSVLEAISDSLRTHGRSSVVVGNEAQLEGTR